MDDASQHKFDEPTVVLMSVLAFMGDAALLIGLMMAGVPIVGQVVFGLAFFGNIFIVAALGIWFIIKLGSVHEGIAAIAAAAKGGVGGLIGFGAVWVVVGIGLFLGLVSPVKMITVLCAAFLANSRIVKMAAKIALAVAATAATGGAAAPALGAVIPRGGAAAGSGALAAGEAAAAGAEAGAAEKIETAVRGIATLRAEAKPESEEEIPSREEGEGGEDEGGEKTVFMDETSGDLDLRKAA